MSTTYATDQLDALAERARASLPATVNGRIEKAVRLVTSDSVELCEDGTAVVISESDGVTRHRVIGKSCSCADYTFQAPSGWCAHRIAVGMAMRLRSAAQVETLMSSVVEDTPETLDTTTGVLEGKNEVSGDDGLSETLRRGLIYIKHKPFIRFSALLAEAHERGLEKLETTFVSVTSDLALAQCTATFRSGLVVTDVADSTPSNVGASVKPHWVRLSATRAAARALRNALALEMCSVEELGQEEGGR